MEKAQLIVDSLHLSIDAKADRSSIGAAVVLPNPPRGTNYSIVLSDISTFNESLIPRRLISIILNTSSTLDVSILVDPHGDQSNSPRGRRQASINYCPTASEQANNRICPNMCDKDRPRRPQGEHYSMCTLHSDTLVKTLCVK